MNPTASIIVRTYNEEKHLGKLLQGIQNQIVDFDYEIILVDSGSTDATLEIARRYNVIIKEIDPKDFTFGYSLNSGIKIARGKYSVITSAHCYPVDRYWLANIIAPFKNTQVGLVYGRQIGVDITRFSEHQIFAKWFPDHDIDDCTLYFCNNANSAIRNSVWQDCSFDENLTGLEDIDWGRRIKAKGYQICYRADACIHHIHEETSGRIYGRYYREALAYKAIFPNEHFGLFDFIKLFSMNCVADYFHALLEGKLLRNIFDIPLFRFLQFWGTYQAHRYRAPLSRDMRRRLYYPKRPGFFSSEKKKTPKILPPKYIDITKPLTEQLPVWPGDNPPRIEQVKNYDDHGVNVSQFFMNVHTGTHVDAPYHFVRNGKKMHEIPLTQMIGNVFVYEIFDERPIGPKDLKKILIPEGTTKLILKTPNSYRPHNQQFYEHFTHITPEAAQWIVDQGFHLIGIDAPSIQGFHDPNNKTHEILLENEVVILEGLDLSSVTTGNYQLIALPMNLPHAEGAPVRAILYQTEGKL